MRRRFIILSALSTALALQASAAEQTTPEGQTLTVATFNINWGNPNLPEVVRVIRQSQADVVALQETNEASERYLRRHLSNSYPHMHFRPPTGGFFASGFAFLSKIPLGRLRYLGPNGGMFGSWACQVTWAGKRLQIVNVHLQPFLLPQGGSLAAVLRLFAQIEDVHAQEIAAIHKALSSETPAVVLGDFNSLSMGKAPRYLTSKGLIDGFGSVNEKPDQHPTWQWQLRDVNLAFRVDYVFHSKGVSTIESRIIQTNASDHYPVVSRLRFLGEEP